MDNRMRSRLSLAIILFGCLLLSAWPALALATHAAKIEGVAIEHAEIVLAGPGEDSSSGFLSIWNGTKSAAYLVSVEAEFFGSVSIHQTLFAGDTAQVRPVSGELVIPSHSELAMKPNGIHLRLSGPRSVIKAGQTMTVKLRFLDGSVLETEADLLGSGSTVTDHHHGEGDRR